jgi:hypothetical protein
MLNVIGIMGAQMWNKIVQSVLIGKDLVSDQIKRAWGELGTDFEYDV